MASILNTLQSQLTQFGLNPSDWIVEIKYAVGQTLHIEVHSHAHQELRFEGRAREALWLDLVLCEF